MAAVLLVAITTLMLLPSSGALSDLEKSQFTARMHTEKNTLLQGTVTVTDLNTTYYRLESNGIPDHTTGTFPGRGNPNDIESQTHTARLSVSPIVAATQTCLPMGAIGYSKNGIPIYNPLNSGGENAVEGDNAEVFDSCNGHPDMHGRYHYHQNPVCLGESGNDEFIGIALDGFPIYGNKDCNGNIIASSDLDICHGRMEGGQYRYRLTADYPYILGCFKGTPSPDILPRMLRNNCKFLNVTRILTVTMTTECGSGSSGSGGQGSVNPTTPSSAGSVYSVATTTMAPLFIMICLRLLMSLRI